MGTKIIFKFVSPDKAIYAVADINGRIVVRNSAGLINYDNVPHDITPLAFKEVDAVCLYFGKWVLKFTAATNEVITADTEKEDILDSHDACLVHNTANEYYCIYSGKRYAIRITNDNRATILECDQTMFPERFVEGWVRTVSNVGNNEYYLMRNNTYRHVRSNPSFTDKLIDHDEYTSNTLAKTFDTFSINTDAIKDVNPFEYVNQDMVVPVKTASDPVQFMEEIVAIRMKVNELVAQMNRCEQAFIKSISKNVM